MPNTPIEDSTYVLFLWPFSQAFMDEPWFDKLAILADAESIGESQAWFIPLDKVNETLNP